MRDVKVIGDRSHHRYFAWPSADALADSHRVQSLANYLPIFELRSQFAARVASRAHDNIGTVSFCSHVWQCWLNVYQVLWTRLVALRQHIRRVKCLDIFHNMANVGCPFRKLRNGLNHTTLDDFTSRVFSFRSGDEPYLFVSERNNPVPVVLQIAMHSRGNNRTALHFAVLPVTRGSCARPFLNANALRSLLSVSGNSEDVRASDVFGACGGVFAVFVDRVTTVAFFLFNGELGGHFTQVLGRDALVVHIVWVQRLLGLGINFRV